MQQREKDVLLVALETNDTFRNIQENWYLIEFNDGVLFHKKIWMSSKSLRRFQRHYCYYRSVQHRSFFQDHKSEEHRHWCYGCPPRPELGGPEQSTHAAVVASRSKSGKSGGSGGSSLMSRMRLSIKGKYFSATRKWCAQCDHCKEYFCAGHLQSHKISSDKGCNEFK